jgi:hypothetical protein
MVKGLLAFAGCFLVVACVFGQSLEFSNVTKLPPTINSSGEESMPLLSPDQSRLYFIRSVYDGNTGGKYAGQDIWVSEKKSDKWTTASNDLNMLNGRENDVLIGMKKDGRTLYTFRSTPSEKLEGIYFTTMVNNRWTSPAFVPIEGIDNDDFIGMFVSPDYDVLFISMKASDSRGEEDLYISLKEKSGAWTTPRNLGPTINTPGFEISPFLSPDKKRLFFASNGHEGFGDADLFYCERLYNSWETWSSPINLGPLVNSKKFDAYLSIYGDSVAYFVSNRDQQLSDIYRATVKVDPGLLSPGQKYLTQEEWNSAVGKNVLQKFTFAPQIKTLNSAQRELIYYIAKKISDKRDLNVHILVAEEEDPEITRERLKEIYGELRQAGIDAYRIKEDQKAEFIKRSDQGVIQLMLFK